MGEEAIYACVAVTAETARTPRISTARLAFCLRLPPDERRGGGTDRRRRQDLVLRCRRAPRRTRNDEGPNLLHKIPRMPGGVFAPLPLALLVTRFKLQVWLPTNGGTTHAAGSVAGAASPQKLTQTMPRGYVLQHVAWTQHTSPQIHHTRIGAHRTIRNTQHVLNVTRMTNPTLTHIHVAPTHTHTTSHHITSHHTISYHKS